VKRTSTTDPLRIDEVDVGSGKLGLTFCPGKYHPCGHSGNWARDLDADLERIRAWGAKIVVTAMEEHELLDCRVPSIGAAVEALGIDWHHLPIVDGGVPDQRAEARWRYTGARLQRLLDAGGRAVIHCLGGLGRTGTLAARLLVERGLEPGTAIDCVRAARPGAIETAAQERHVRGLRPGRPSASPSRAERVLGCLIGGAVGDGFGYAVEFERLVTIRRRFGPSGMQSPVYADDLLLVSDDTQMTMFTLEGLIDGKRGQTPAIDAVHAAYLRWFDTQGNGRSERTSGAPLTAATAARGSFGLIDHRLMIVARAPGNTCLSALASGRRGTRTMPLNSSKGCGGVMRVAPVGFVPLEDDMACFDLAADLAAITHGHPAGWQPAGALAVMIRAAAEGDTLGEAVIRAIEALAETGGADETLAAIGSALEHVERDEPIEAAYAELGEGWVGEEALAIALWAALTGNGHAEVIALAANHDGDSDSTASIAAQLVGAAHGIEGLPHAWIRRLDVLDPLLQLSNELIG